MKWTTAYVDALPDSAFAFIAADGSRHLPYKNSDGKVDLPHVRNALARLNQVKDMTADERSKVKEKLQGSLKASDAHDEVLQSLSVIQADDKGNLPQRMMLLRAGTFFTQKYGEVPLSASDITEMADNFHKGFGMAAEGQTGLPVDYSHESHKNAGAWIKDMAVENGDELWATNLEWTGSGRKAISDKEYKMLSADFYPASFGEWVDPESGASARNVIVGAAFTNRPMFSGNQPVIASETTDKGGQNTNKVIYVIASQDKETKMSDKLDINAVRVKAAEDVSGEEQRFLQASYEELSGDERKKFDLVEPVKADDKKDEKPVQASSVKGDEGTVKIEASEVKGMQDKISALEASETKRETVAMEAEVDKHIKRGALKADRKESYVKRLVAADETERDELLTDLKAMASNPVLAEEQGKGDADETSTTDARKQIMDKATELVKKGDGKIDIKAAVATVKSENPELAAAAAAERKNVIEASDAEFKAAGINRG